jgi:hypothetical protein
MRTALRAADQLRRFPCLGSHDRRRLHNCAHGGASEFLDFMNDIVAAHANTAIHVILDNLNTHKPRPLAQASSERAFPLHTDAGLLAQLGTVREVSPRFVCDCCSPTNSLDKARALFAAYGKRRPRLTIRQRSRVLEKWPRAQNAERLCGRVSTALQIAAYTNV